MIEAAREQVGTDPRFTIVQADATQLPVASGSMDVVVAVRLILHVRNPEVVFAEVARVLRPGGLFVLEFPNRRHLLARLRYLARRQDWSPDEADPHEYREGHFSHQPATVVRQLRRAGLAPTSRRAVSLFRSAPPEIPRAGPPPRPHRGAPPGPPGPPRPEPFRVHRVAQASGGRRHRSPGPRRGPARPSAADRRARC